MTWPPSHWLVYSSKLSAAPSPLSLPAQEARHGYGGGTQRHIIIIRQTVRVLSSWEHGVPWAMPSFDITGAPPLSRVMVSITDSESWGLDPDIFTALLPLNLYWAGSVRAAGLNINEVEIIGETSQINMGLTSGWDSAVFDCALGNDIVI